MKEEKENATIRRYTQKAFPYFIRGTDVNRILIIAYCEETILIFLVVFLRFQNY